MSSSTSSALKLYETIVNQNPDSNSDIFQKLIIKRHRAWISAAKNSLRGIDPMKTCYNWSLAADQVLIEAFESTFNKDKYLLIAYGKLGSKELNISSDVDILVVAVDNNLEDWRASLQAFQKIVGERTALGFCHRLDFDLRPGGRHGTLIPSMEQFEDYYGNYGETWERLAFVRMRILSGPQDSQDRLTKFVSRFVWRKHLDFSLMDDLKKIRQKIQGQQSTELQSKNSFNLKMSPGGIRDIELFTHALQVIHGGKAVEIRLQSTVAALLKLAELNFLPKENAVFLSDLYIELRGLENYVQAINDEHLHSIILNDEHPEWVEKQITNVINNCKKSSNIVSEILGTVSTATDELNLSELHISDLSINQHWAEILDTPILSRNKERDFLTRQKFLSVFLKRMHAHKGEMNRGLALLKDFMKSIRAKNSFFDLLLHKDDLLDELAWLFGHSPYLAGILTGRPELLDSYIYRSQAQPNHDWDEFLTIFIERRLLNELISGADFLRTKNLDRLLKSCSNNAHITIEAIVKRIYDDIPSQIKVIPLGKWGGNELGLRSDLDFVISTPHTPTSDDFKATRRLVNRLTENHKGGSIYSIDMRLRPSGSSGPLIIQESDLINWLSNDSLPWERQAWLRSEEYQKFCLMRKLSDRDYSQLYFIQQELHKKSTSKWDIKYAPGGLLDIELFIQTCVLQKNSTISGTSTSDFFNHVGLLNCLLETNYSRLRQIDQMLQLISAYSATNLHENHECLPQLAEALQMTPSQLISHLDEIFMLNIRELNKLDPRRSSQ